ncbi:MAG: hypothetical protein LBT09_07185 [Planctomycetaceae bacterium]|jgi:hypothetical protein|nr:hypothetical protein [Planctomycetaceae bacterium]
MTDTEILQQLINIGATAQPQLQHNRNYVELCDPQAGNSCVKIYGLPDDIVVIKADKFPPPHNIFQGSKGERKRADYILISEEKKCIIFLEMKKTNDTQKEIILQLKGAQCVMRYCQEVGISFWNKADFLNGYKHRFVSVCHTNIHKTKTRQNQSLEKILINQQHSKPNFIIKVAFPNHVEFNKIAALDHS